MAELVASEFFEQGDMERFQLNAEPIVSKTVFDLIYLACISVNKDAALLEVCIDKMERFCMKLSTHSSTSPFLYYPWVEWFKSDPDPRASAKFEFRFENLKSKFSLILFVYFMMIG